MKNTEVRIERRKDKRFLVRNGAFVTLGSSDSVVGRIIDVSMGGLTFYCVDCQRPSLKATELEIFVTGNAFRLGEVPCQSIWDLTLPEVAPSSLHTKQCGVQFGDLTPYQKSQLEHFIQHHTKGEVKPQEENWIPL